MKKLSPGLFSSTPSGAVEVIDIDSDELGEFNALAVCSGGGGGGMTEMVDLPVQNQIEIALKAIHKEATPAEIANAHGVSVDVVYACAAALVKAGREAMEKKD